MAAIRRGNVGQKVHSQVAERRPGNIEDQHGRRYWAWIDKKTNHPVGANWQPSEGWLVPDGSEPDTAWCKGRLNPPNISGQEGVMQTVETDRGTKLIINYENWLRIWDVADRERTTWLKDQIRADGEKAGRTLSQISAEQANPPAEYLNVVGGGPGVQIPRQFIVAMSRGNRWCLGLPNPDGSKALMPAWARAVVKEWRKMQPIAVYRDPGQDENEYPDADDESRSGVAEIVPAGAAPQYEAAPVKAASTEPKARGWPKGKPRKPAPVAAEAR